MTANRNSTDNARINIEEIARKQKLEGIDILNDKQAKSHWGKVDCGLGSKTLREKLSLF